MLGMEIQGTETVILDRDCLVKIAVVVTGTQHNMTFGRRSTAIRQAPQIGNRHARFPSLTVLV
jgi:hypothetical protein